MPYINVEVELEEFDTEEILNDLVWRLKKGRLKPSEKQIIVAKIVEAAGSESEVVKPDKWRTQQDDLKQDALNEIAEKFTLQQLWQIKEQGHC